MKTNVISTVEVEEYLDKAVRVMQTHMTIEEVLSGKESTLPASILRASMGVPIDSLLASPETATNYISRLEKSEKEKLLSLYSRLMCRIPTPSVKEVSAVFAQGAWVHHVVSSNDRHPVETLTTLAEANLVKYPILFVSALFSNLSAEQYTKLGVISSNKRSRIR